ncbi:hypothetical protein PR048_025588 [Dryococelus australis]|uniref:E3 ubiquitin-protein ligase APD1-4 middle domain-containing protein n=1 Tax=Dryococelus australis TaxID=614101 RepID=A0ABQ9GRS1_9NEOP|nr:hypothetical protein PR048_025588 [Dryococelus australis]
MMDMYPGSHILVVKGEKNLQTCGLMDHSEKQGPIHMATNHDQVRITLETRAEVIHDDHNAAAIKDGVARLGKMLEHRQDKGAAEYVVDDNTASEDESDSESDSDELNKDLPGLEELVAQHLQKHHLLGNTTDRKHRHAKRRGEKEGRVMKSLRTGVDVNNRNSSRTKIKKALEKLFNTDDGEKKFKRQKRNKSRSKRNLNPGHVLDAGIGHGGNAGVVNVTNIPPEQVEESAASSFENDLLACYGGQILLVNPFPSSTNCTSQHLLESNHRTMKTIHDVLADGYYYYIFYSDNDYVQNDIHVTFDIHKPTYQYANFTKGCVNQTVCAFPISFMSNEIVIVEVPTRDGIEHEEDDITLLISSLDEYTRSYVMLEKGNIANMFPSAPAARTRVLDSGHLQSPSYHYVLYNVPVGSTVCEDGKGTSTMHIVESVGSLEGCVASD